MKISRLNFEDEHFLPNHYFAVKIKRNFSSATIHQIVEDVVHFFVTSEIPYIRHQINGLDPVDFRRAQTFFSSNGRESKTT